LLGLNHSARDTFFEDKVIATLETIPVLHGDNGSTLKATTVLAMLQWLGVKPSYSRPRVSDDNACAESLFRTAKYRPEFPAKGFASWDQARSWAAEFVRWYNVDHRHSGIRYVSPQQRHAGDDKAILQARHALYTQAQQRNPARWSGHTRDWSHIGAVTLNPEHDDMVSRVASAQHTQQEAA
jgi:putative transposase